MERRPQYEWDAEKEARNLEKHYMSLADAWRVFESPERLDAPSPRPSELGRRIAMAYDGGQLAVCTLVYVIRNDRVRFISYRRSSRREREAYREYLEEDRPIHE